MVRRDQQVDIGRGGFVVSEYVVPGGVVGVAGEQDLADGTGVQDDVGSVVEVLRAIALVD